MNRQILVIGDGGVERDTLRKVVAARSIPVINPTKLRKDILDRWARNPCTKDIPETTKGFMVTTALAQVIENISQTKEEMTASG